MELSIVGRNLLFLDIPASLSEVDKYTFYMNSNSYASRWFEFISVHAVDPINISAGTFDGHQNPLKGILFVPKSSKQNYATSTGWNSFGQIIESEDEGSGEIIREHDFTFMVVNGAAVVVGYHGDDNLIIPDEIEYNGVKLPVEFITSSALKYLTLSSVQLPKHLRYIDIAMLPSLIRLTINEDLLNFSNEYSYNSFPNICYLKNSLHLDLKDQTTANSTFYTQSIYANFDCGSLANCFVPGETIKVFEESIKANITEMWSYQIDRKNGIFKRCPEIEGLVINEILVNGESASPVATDIYSLPSDDNLDIVVSYTLHGLQPMTTHYPAEFNVSVPDSNLSFSDIMIDANATFNVYNMSGLRLRENATTLNGLPSGLYIIRQGLKARKIAIK